MINSFKYKNEPVQVIGLLFALATSECSGEADHSYVVFAEATLLVHTAMKVDEGKGIKEDIDFHKVASHAH